MFKERLISGIVLVLLALLTIISGGYVLFGTLLAISLIGLGEFYRATKVQGNGSNALAIGGYLVSIAYYGLLLLDRPELHEMAYIAMLILFLSVYVFSFPKFTADKAMAAFFGVLYVPVMLSCIYRTRMLTDGQFLVWLIFLCSWGCDTCAYCVGMLIGKHKMSPVLSPKKSIEGAVGGVLGAMLLGALFALAVGKHLQSGPQVAAFAIICGVGALISMVGDLAASGIKRNVGIKDYGTLIPGHGGILDRFDSVIFTAPIIYFLSAMIIR